jgi:DNA helicase-2/ATP-dependent DNA helicase PcrA
LYGAKEPEIPLAKPVIRHGDPVKKVTVPDLRACAGEIDKKITTCLNAGYRSAAVLCKTLKDCKTLQKLLKSKVQLLDGRNHQFAGGLLILPSYLAKGFEFDAVIAADLTGDSYGENSLDIKLLYIAMTRALHDLTIFTVGGASLLISHLT